MNARPGESLSFLGFGLPTTVPGWGMLSREGREYMEIAPRQAVWPGLCLTVVVYCLNMVGDAVRDLLDPRRQRPARRLRRPGGQQPQRGSDRRGITSWANSSMPSVLGKSMARTMTYWTPASM